MGMTDLQRTALEAYRANGENMRATARALNKSYSNVHRMVTAALKHETAPPGMVKSIETTGLDVSRAKHGWRIIQHEDGSRDSVFWKNDESVVSEDTLTDAIATALSDISPPELVSRPMPDTTTEELCAVFPVADLHIGLLTDQEEVGSDWDTKKAIVAFENTFGRLVGRTPDANVAILGQLGDLTHNDDQCNVTPQSGHQLDVDSRYFMIVRRAVSAMTWAIDLLRQKYPNVVYRGCRGNHDMTTHIAVTMALSIYYKDIPNVEIVDSATEFYVHQFGKNMFVFHHGDRAKPERLLPFVANEWASIWGTTKHRVAFSGHVHHEWVKEMAGMCFRSVGTIIPRDVHAFSNAYGSNRCLMSLTYDTNEGEIATARVNL